MDICSQPQPSFLHISGPQPWRSHSSIYSTDVFTLAHTIQSHRRCNRYFIMSTRYILLSASLRDGEGRRVPCWFVEVGHRWQNVAGRGGIVLYTAIYRAAWTYTAGWTSVAAYRRNWNGRWTKESNTKTIPCALSLLDLSYEWMRPFQPQPAHDLPQTSLQYHNGILPPKSISKRWLPYSSDSQGTGSCYSRLSSRSSLQDGLHPTSTWWRTQVWWMQTKKASCHFRTRFISIIIALQKSSRLTSWWRQAFKRSPQLQNFYLFHAITNSWPHYFWAHMDIMIQSSEDKISYLSFYQKAVQRSAPSKGGPGDWSISPMTGSH